MMVAYFFHEKTDTGFASLNVKALSFTATQN